MSDVLRDSNTPNVSTAIVEGNVMRGRYMQLYAQSDPDIDYLSVFNYLVVGYALSEKNVKN